MVTLKCENICNPEQSDDVFVLGMKRCAEVATGFANTEGREGIQKM
jgi:hypothetical protein